MRMTCSCLADCKAATQYHPPLFSLVSELANSSVAPWNLMWCLHPTVYSRSTVYQCNPHTLAFHTHQIQQKSRVGTPIHPESCVQLLHFKAYRGQTIFSWQSKCCDNAQILPCCTLVNVCVLLCTPLFILQRTFGFDYWHLYLTICTILWKKHWLDLCLKY